jgi:hypothetical protein
MNPVKVILVLLALLAAYVAVEQFGRSRARPPESVKTFDTYMAWQTTHRYARQLERDGQRFILLAGPNAGLLPSGPPTYVFDSAGQLIDWTSDSGDDSRFQKEWLNNRDVRTISIDEARAKLTAGTGARATTRVTQH